MQSFTEEHLHDRALVLRMLGTDEQLLRSDEGQRLFREFPGDAAMREMQRRVLCAHGFTQTRQDVNCYRRVCAVYAASPTHYDEEVVQAVTYLRANRLLFYTEHAPILGAALPNVDVYSLSEERFVPLHEAVAALPHAPRALVCAFSTS